jgi:hypothetical protein
MKAPVGWSTEGPFWTTSSDDVLYIPPNPDLRSAFPLTDGEAYVFRHGAGERAARIMARVLEWGETSPPVYTIYCLTIPGPVRELADGCDEACRAIHDQGGYWSRSAGRSNGLEKGRFFMSFFAAFHPCLTKP